ATAGRLPKQISRDSRTVGMGKSCRTNAECKHRSQRCVRRSDAQGKPLEAGICVLPCASFETGTQKVIPGAPVDVTPRAKKRPLRAQKLAELVRIGSGQSALVRGRFELSGGLREVEVEVGREGRSARVDGKTVRDPDELFGGLATVAFTPDDLAVVKGGPEGRRKLLDRAAQNRHPSHLADSRDYLRALRARNELLRQDAPPDLLAS